MTPSTLGPYGGHRETIWRDAEGRVVQCAVACLDSAWEVYVEVVEQVGPFDDLDALLDQARDGAHNLTRSRAHQGTLL